MIINALAARANRQLHSMCAAYTAPIDQVVFEQRAGVVSRILRASPWVEWSRFGGNYATAFLHSRRDAAADREDVVAVQVEPQLRYTYDGRPVSDHPLLCFVVWQITDVGAHRSSARVAACTVLVVLPQPTDSIRVLAGQPDLSDGSRFCIDIEYNGVRETIRGFFADGAVKLRVDSGMPAVAEGWGVDFWSPAGATEGQRILTQQVAASRGAPGPHVNWPAPSWNIPLDALMSLNRPD